MKRFYSVFFFVGLLICIQFLHTALLFILRELHFFSYEQEGIILLVGFQVLLFMGILFSRKYLKIKFNFQKPGINYGILAMVLFLSLFLFIFQTVMDSNFFKALYEGHLRFLIFDINRTLEFQQIIYGLLSIIIAPIIEELLYRRIIFIKLKEYFSVNWSILISSFFFAFMHLDMTGFIAYLFLGIAFTYVYHLTKNLFLNMLLHASFNLFAFVTNIIKYEPNSGMYTFGIFIYILSVIGIVVCLNAIRKKVVY